MEAPHLERKLIAILAADVEGFSRHMERDEPMTLATLSGHRQIIDSLIGEHGGRITGTAGDSVLAEFGSVVSAVTCAVKIQEMLAEENGKLQPERRLMLRIGINVGDVMIKDGDIFGDGVNIAARLEALADPGGICVSRGVRDHLRKHKIVVFDDLGEQKVKNITHPVRAFKVRIGEAPTQDTGEPSDDAETNGNLSLQSFPIDDAELAFWGSVKDSESEAELEVFLERYPDGQFAVLAKSRLEALLEAEAEKPDGSTKTDSETLAVELAFWEAASESGNAAELQAYLERYPKGEFVALAEARLKALQETVEAAPETPEPVGTELAFWESVKDSKNPAMLEAYLRKYPEGSFASLAKIMLDENNG